MDDAGSIAAEGVEGGHPGRLLGRDPPAFIRDVNTRIPISIAVAFATAAFAAVASAAPAAEPFVVSRQSASAGAMEANKDAGNSDVSANGRYVVFESGADNLSPMADDVRNVYRYDTRLEKVELVSRNGKKGADAKSLDPAISANGRYVAFRSNARNLGPTDKNVYLNIYVYDARRNRTELASRQSASDGGRPANDWSEDPDISANGRVVSFTTTASNLGGQVNTRRNIYVYDRKEKQAELVSRQSDRRGGNGGNDESTGSVLSDNGRYVAFTSRATNLTGGPGAPYGGFVYDRRRERTVPVSSMSGDRDPYSYVGSLSGNGKRVAYYVSTKGRDKGWFVSDVGGADRVKLGREMDTVRLSGDGRLAAATETFRRRLGGQSVDATRVVRINLGSGRRQVVSEPMVRPDGDDRPSDAWEPAISGDGRAISFTGGMLDRAGSPDLVFLRRYR